MSNMPRRSHCRPDFLAPGPHVHIKKHAEMDFDSKYLVDSDDEDEDSEDVKYQFYESNKILGHLYREIDERSIFESVASHAAKITAHPSDELLQRLWMHVQKRCSLFEWEHYRSLAESIIDMYVIVTLFRPCWTGFFAVDAMICFMKHYQSLMIRNSQWYPSTSRD